MGVRIDDLPPAFEAFLGHLVPAMLPDGATTSVSVAQILKLVLGEVDPSRDTLSEISDLIDQLDQVLGVVTDESIPALAPKNSPALTGTPTAPTPTAGDNTTRIATTAFVTAAIVALSNSLGDVRWSSKAIGEVVLLPINLTGVSAPPIDSSVFRFARLTAGQTGAGAYNNGVLNSESVSGSAPLVLATANISLTGSPMLGQTIRLLNTEFRFIRPGTSPGTIASDQMQGHNHSVHTTPSGAANLPTNGLGNSFQAPTGKGGTQIGFQATDIVTDGVFGTPRIGGETYPKHVQFEAYMRVK